MLSIADVTCQRTCQGPSRREFLRVGSLALGGLTLPGLMRARAAIKVSGGEVHDRSVVMLFLQGGPSQIETFDPKMDAAVEYRCVTGATQTALPGVSFGSTFPRMAKLADRLAIVRSYASLNGEHKYDPVTTAGNTLQASWAAIYSHLAGAIHPRAGTPNNILVLPEAVGQGLKLQRNFEFDHLPGLTAPGLLGLQHQAFNPAGGSELRQALNLRLPREIGRAHV